MASYDCFISYSRDDLAFATQLCRELGRQGTRGFLDRQDISAGASFDETLRSAIADSDALVVIVSPRTTSSNWVLAEIGIAQALGKRIIPVLAPGASLDDAASTLFGDYLILDAGTLPVEETSARIVAAVKGIALEHARRLVPAARRRRRLFGIVLVALILVLLIVLYRFAAT